MLHVNYLQLGVRFTYEFSLRDDTNIFCTPFLKVHVHVALQMILNNGTLLPEHTHSLITFHKYACVAFCFEFYTRKTNRTCSL